ncbi:MAG: FecR family protein [Candidatus Xenobia bacterium]
MILGLIGTMLVPLATVAQQPMAVASVRLTATRGRVEMMSPSGQWVRLTGTTTAQVGTAVRTAEGAEMTATFPDGSAITMTGGSGMRFTELAQNRTGLKVIGDATASLSPGLLASTTVAVDMPVGRATLNRDFAVGHAVRAEAASSLASVHLQTPTARAVRVAVLEGACTVQGLYNVAGTVMDRDAAAGTFTLRDEKTGQPHRVTVGASTLLAAADLPDARANSNPQMVIQALAQHEHLIVYGNPVGAEGPVAQATGGVNATVIYPDNAQYLNGDAWLQTPQAPTSGPGLAGTKGYTLEITAGALVPLLFSGVALSSSLTSQVAAGAAGGAVGVGTVLAGVAAVTAGAVVASNNRSNTIAAAPVLISSSSGATGSINLTVQRPGRRHAALATAPLLTANPGAGLAGIFAGTANPFSVSTQDSAVSAMWRLSPRMKARFTANFNGNSTMSGLADYDIGVDYLIDSYHAIGAGWQAMTLSLVDPFGNLSSQTQSGPELHFMLRY